MDISAAMTTAHNSAARLLCSALIAVFSFDNVTSNVVAGLRVLWPRPLLSSILASLLAVTVAGVAIQGSSCMAPYKNMHVAAFLVERFLHDVLNDMKVCTSATTMLHLSVSNHFSSKGVAACSYVSAPPDAEAEMPPELSAVATPIST